MNNNNSNSDSEYDSEYESDCEMFHSAKKYLSNEAMQIMQEGTLDMKIKMVGDIVHYLFLPQFFKQENEKVKQEIEKLISSFQTNQKIRIGIQELKACFKHLSSTREELHGEIDKYYASALEDQLLPFLNKISGHNKRRKEEKRAAKRKYLDTLVGEFDESTAACGKCSELILVKDTYAFDHKCRCVICLRCIAEHSKKKRLWCFYCPLHE